MPRLYPEIMTIPEQSGFAADPTFKVAAKPKRPIIGWVEGDVDLAAVYVNDRLHGYLWRGIHEPRSIGFLRAADDDDAQDTDDRWTARIREASESPKFNTPSFFAHWMGFDNGVTRVALTLGRSTLAAVQQSLLERT